MIMDLNQLYFLLIILNILYLNYSSSIIFNPIDLTFIVETDDTSLKGMTESIILNGILSSGAQQTILFNVDFNMMVNIGPPYFSESIDSLVAYVGKTLVYKLPQIIEPDNDPYTIRLEPFGSHNYNFKLLRT